MATLPNFTFGRELSKAEQDIISGGFGGKTEDTTKEKPMPSFTGGREISQSEQDIINKGFGEDIFAPTQTIDTQEESRSSKLASKQQQEFIDSINKLAKLRKEEEQKQSVRAKKGILGAGQTTAQPTVGGLDLSGRLADQLSLGADTTNTQALLEQESFNIQQQGLKDAAKIALSQTKAGQDLLNAGVSLDTFTTEEMRNLAKQGDFELSNRQKERLQAEGKHALEAIEINKTSRLDENKFMKNQLDREFNRAIDDRTEFNALQDAKLKRMFASFGGGRADTLAGNASIMREAEKGQRVVEDLRLNFIDRQSLLSGQADEVINTYSNNRRLIESEMTDVLENKRAQLGAAFDELVNAGVTNRNELNQSLATLKKDFVDLYVRTTDKAFTELQNQNQQLQANAFALQQQEQADQERLDNLLTENTEFIYYRGEPIMQKQQINELTAQDINLMKMGLTTDEDGNIITLPSDVSEAIINFKTKEEGIGKVKTGIGVGAGASIAESVIEGVDQETGLYNKFLKLAKEEGLTDKSAISFANKRVEDSFKPLTDAQGKSFNAFVVMGAEDKDLKEITKGLDQKEFAKTINKISRKAKGDSLTSEIINRFTKDANIRQAILSEMRWLEGALREESGAAISVEEYSSKGTAFFPRAGDDAVTIKKKQEARDRATKAKFIKMGASAQRQALELEAPQPKVEPPKVEQPKVEPPKVEPPKVIQPEPEPLKPLPGFSAVSIKELSQVQNQISKSIDKGEDVEQLKQELIQDGFNPDDFSFEGGI